MLKWTDQALLLYLGSPQERPVDTINAVGTHGRSPWRSPASQAAPSVTAKCPHRARFIGKIRHLYGQAGVALVEVLMAGIILAVAVIGVSLLLSNAEMAVVGQGDRYVALYLAQQKIEKLTAAAIRTPPVGFDSVPTGDSTTTGGCATDIEPCYNESNLLAGEQVGASAQRFTRTTCVNFVNDDDPTTPPACTPCTTGGTCTNNTKRITVTVTPPLADPATSPVTMVTVITRHVPCDVTAPCQGN